MNAFVLELYYSYRRLRVASQFSIVAIATLALGIGAACTIFSAVNAVLIQPLPYADPGRLYILSETWDRYIGPASYENYRDWARLNTSFSELGIYSEEGANLIADGAPERVRAAYVTSSLLRVLAVPAWRGRLLTDDDTAQDRPRALVLTYAYWQQRFRGDSKAIGRTITLDGGPATIVGILPPRFRFPINEALVDIFAPLILKSRHSERGWHSYPCYGRLKPGVSPALASQDMNRVASDLARKFPGTNTGRTVHLSPVEEVATRDLRKPFRLLFGAVMCLLLIACVNVGNLMLSRASVRKREFAIRMALGAGRARLAWQFLAEGLLLASASGLLGLILGYAGLMGITSVPDGDWARDYSLHPLVFAFAIAVTLLSATLPCLPPLWQILRSNPEQFLKEGARSTPERSTRLLRNALMVAETAGATMLLIAAALLMNSFVRLNHVDSGLDPRGVITASISLPLGQDNGTASPFFPRLIDKLRKLPGVRFAGAVSLMPVRDYFNNIGIYIDGLPSQNHLRMIENRIVAGDYFQTVGLRLLRGRFFGPQDDTNSERVVIINQAAVNQFFPAGHDALGSIIRTDDAPGATPIRVVGIVSDYRNYGLHSRSAPEAYAPLAQFPQPSMKLMVRTDGVRPIEPALRNAVRELNPTVPVYDVKGLPEVISQTLSGQRLETVLWAVFGLTALLLAASGIYAVTSYAVGQRAREIGVRMALGASHQTTFRQTTLEALRLNGIGLVAGLILAAALSKTLTSLLFQVSPFDPLSYLAATLLLGSAAFAASVGPARWASRIDPAITLRQDGSALQLLPPRTAPRPPASDLAGEFNGDRERALIAGVAHAARQSSDWQHLFSSVTKFIAEACRVDDVTLLSQNGDRSFQTFDHRLSLPASAFIVRRLRRFEGVLPVSEDDFVVWQHALAGDPAAWAERSSEVQALRRMRARFAVPIRSGAGLIGVLVLGRSEGKRSAAPALMVLSGQLGLLLENHHLAQRAAEAEFLQRELDLAADVQRRLLPAHPPAIHGIQVAGLCRPALGVGGDYFDYFAVENGRLAFVLADVAGKGIAAALVVSMLYSALRTLAPNAAGNVARMLGELNRLLQRATQPRAFATLFYAEYDPATRCLHYVNAAHMPALLRRNGDITRLPGKSPVVGMFARAEYQQHTARLEPGDRLLIYSDGVTESPNASGEDFGEERLRTTLLALPGDAVEAAKAVADAVANWAGSREAFDDITVMVIDVADAL